LGTTYYPDPNADTSRGQTRKAIAGTTNATPIKVNVTTHGYATGDSVEVFGSQDPNAFGQWNITYVDADHFTLDGSVGTLAGAALGFVKNYSVLPYASIPSDGDLVDATNANTPVENSLNGGPFLYRLTGAQRVFEFEHTGVSDDTWAAWSTNASGIFGTSAWATIASGGSIISPSPAMFIDQGDIIEVWASMTVTTTGGTGLAAVGIGINLAGTPTVIPGTGLRLPTANTTFLPLTFHGRQIVSAGGSNQTLDLDVMGYGNPGSPQNVNFVGHRSVTLHILKKN
jgi:hypothetical protein